MGNSVKYIIVEDEPAAREMLLKKINMCNIRNLMCVGMAETVKEVLLITKLNKPDFILLDISLPGGTGFDLIEMLRQDNLHPEIIFTSAHTEKENLLRAIKTFPSSYLTKPIDLDELEIALRKVMDKLEVPSNVASSVKLYFSGVSGPVFLNSDEIVYFKAKDRYAEVCITSGEIIRLQQTFSSVAEKLEDLSQYMQADRSTIVNMDYLTQIHAKRRIAVFQKDGVNIEVPLAESGIKKLKEEIKA